MEVYSAGTLKVSKRIWAAVSRLLLGLRGGSVNKTGCCRSHALASILGLTSASSASELF